MAIRLTIYKKGSDIPKLPELTLEHSTKLFHVYEQTDGYSPYLIVAFDSERPIAKLLAVVRKSTRLFPPSIIKRCEIYRCGDYFDTNFDKEEIFGEMLEYITREVIQQAFLIEVRNIEQPLFGYKYFKQNHYFPISWLRVYNSLHSLPPKDRLSPVRKRQINKAIQRGVTTQLVKTEEELEAFLKLLKKAYRSKISKHFPDFNFFRLLMLQNHQEETAQAFIVKHKDKIIGGSFCIYSGNNTYLWFSSSIKNTNSRLYPGVMAVWCALTDAYEKGYNHFEFMDAGLPFKNFNYRNFIISFGGKQVSTRRWFRFRWKWLNKLVCWFYK